MSNNHYTTLIDVKNVKYGMYVLLKNNPCKITDIMVNYKVAYNLSGKNIFNYKLYNDIFTESGLIEKVIVKISKYLFCGFDNDYLFLVDSEGNEKISIKKPNNKKYTNILENNDIDDDKDIVVYVLSAMDEEVVDKVVRESF